MIRLMVVAVGCLVVIDDGPSLPSAYHSYEEMKAKTGRDAEAQVRLALWCESHGLERERLKHLAVAVLTDPSNAMARGLMGLVEYQGKWRKPETVAEAMKSDVAAADLLAEYNGRRVRAPLKAEPQWKLAQWCREKGLIAESRAHLATVVRLDPNHADAWKALGYRKVGQRWITEGQAAAEKAEQMAQAKADKEWRPRLERLREALGRKQGRATAERELATITDPRAVPSVVKAFASHDSLHTSAVQLLGQVDAAAASRTLAALALFSRSDEARRRATETLKRRDPREWVDLPIGLIRSKIHFEVKPVGGPGSPGELYVEGKKANLKRIYRPDDLPQLQPGDRLVTNDRGELILIRPSGQGFWTGMASPKELGPSLLTGLPLWEANQLFATRQAADVPRNRLQTTAEVERVLAQHGMRGEGATVAQGLGSQLSQSNMNKLLAAQAGGQVSQIIGGNINQTTQADLFLGRTQSIPVDQLMRDAKNSAIVAADQLKSDVEAIELSNSEIAKENQAAVFLLSSTTGQTFGDDRKGWEKWFVDQLGYAFMTPTEDKPTVIENVPINYQPTALPTPGMEVLAYTRVSCFGKGTPVRTISGSRPIEELNVGDKVLAQDTKTGKLGYRPVLIVHRNPPSPTFRVDLDGQPVVASHFHRFWKAGQGWVMARDLKVGDPIRTLGGVAKVTAIEADKVQPVFNLDVADDADFFAGSVAALVHDNTLPDLRQAPFDAPPAVAAVR